MKRIHMMAGVAEPRFEEGFSDMDEMIRVICLVAGVAEMGAESEMGSKYSEWEVESDLG